MGLPDSGNGDGPAREGLSNQEQLATLLGKVPAEALEITLQHVELHAKTPEERADRLKIALENIQLYYNKILPRMMESSEPSVPEIVDMLVDSCMVEKNMDEALTHFATRTHNQGMEIELDQMKFRGWIEKLGNLRMYRKLIHSMGLGPFENELIAAEISRTMTPGQPTPPAPPKGK